MSLEFELERVARSPERLVSRHARNHAESIADASNVDRRDGQVAISVGGFFVRAWVQAVFDGADGQRP